MKKGLIIVEIFVWASWLGGCGVFIGEQTRDTADVTIAEIDMVGKLSFDSERKDRYGEIAIREGLTAWAQVHLVEAVLDNLAHDSVKEEVLLMLIANPSFSGSAEREIKGSIDKLAFESTKKKILKVIELRAER